jgi:alpha-aminoadipic semialdehyde synthase
MQQNTVLEYFRSCMLTHPKTLFLLVCRLIVVSDISCDPGGSIEFFERSTTIDRPSYQYDPIQGREVTDHIDNIGVTLLGVDILPTELPADSSRHFGNKLSHILEDFVLVKATSQERALNISKFPQKLKQATITTIEGLLNPPFQYLDSLMKPSFVDGRSRDTSKFMVLHLDGHLFDSGLINHVLDLIERHECCFEFEKCFVPRRSVESCPVRSQAILKVTGEACVDLIALAKKVRDLVDAIHSADATLNVIDKNNTIACVEDPEDRTVLVLGSGMVSKSVVELLGRSNDRMIIVASDNEAQARRSAQAARRGQHACLDVENDRQRVADLVKQCDLVVSMLPAPMHPEVAELCIKYKKDMVTASYESEMMRKYREA